jgi:hypothetical protein
MAYVSREKKMKICELLKSAVPKDWKYTVSVNHFSTLCFNLKSSPVDLIGVANAEKEGYQFRVDFELREHNTKWYPADVKAVLDGIFKVLNTDNFNESDSQSDYFHVGHYVNFNVGRWNKPYLCTGTSIVKDENEKAQLVHA